MRFSRERLLYMDEEYKGTICMFPVNFEFFYPGAGK